MNGRMAGVAQRQVAEGEAGFGGRLRHIGTHLEGADAYVMLLHSSIGRDEFYSDCRPRRLERTRAPSLQRW